MERSRSAVAATAIIGGGLVAAVTFVPFTLSHGPTSYNLEREVLGWDMHRWGLVMGTVPELLIAVGLWRLRGLIAGERRVTAVALTVMCAAMILFAAMNAYFGGIGPPFDLFLLPPAAVLLASTTQMRGPARAALTAVATAYCAGLTFAFIPLEASDLFGGYRVFGLITYFGVGLLWATFGAILALRTRPLQ
jgi:hypothetical protein